MSYATLLLVALVGKFADVISTWIVSPDLKLEGNPISRKMGWKGILATDFILCFLCALNSIVAFGFSVGSLMLAINNISIGFWLPRKTRIFWHSAFVIILAVTVLIASKHNHGLFGVACGFLAYSVAWSTWSVPIHRK